MKKLFAIVTILLLCFNVSAQTAVNPTATQRNLTGRIADEGGTAVAYATVVVLTPDNQTKKAMVTDSLGRFAFRLPVGKYTLRASFLGYKSASQPVELGAQDIAVDNLKLVASPITIDDVVVRPLVEVNPDKITYNITSDPERAHANMNEILSKVPLLSIDPDGKLEVNSESDGFIITRNGRPDPMFSAAGVPIKEVLARLTAMGFTKVSVMLNPPSKYGNVKYVVDIETDKTNRLFGVVGNTAASYGMQQNSTDAEQGITGSAGRLRFAVKGNYSYYDTPNTTTNTVQHYLTSGNTLTRASIADSRGYSYGGNVELSLDITARQFVSASFNIGKSSDDTFRNALLTDTQYIGFSGATSENHIRGNSVRTPISGNISYQVDFNNYRSLILSYALNDSNSTGNNYIETLDNVTPLRTLTNSPTTTDLRSHIFSAYYSDKIGEKLSYNARIDYADSRSTTESPFYNLSDGTPQEVRSSYSAMNNTTRRTDGTLSLIWNASLRLNINAQALVDYYTDGSRLETVTGDNQPKYVDQKALVSTLTINASLFIPTKPTAKKRATPSWGKRLSLRYSLTSRRPSATQLSNYVNEISSDYISVGNPDLHNEVYHNITFSRMGGRILNPALTFIYSGNRITRYWYLNDKGQTVERYRNGGSYRSIIFSHISGYRITKSSLLRVQLYANYTEDEVESQTSRSFGVTALANYDIPLYKTLRLITSCRYIDTWTKGYNDMRNQDPVTLMLALRGNFKLSRSVSVDLGASINSLIAWRSKTTQNITSSALEFREVSLTNYVPVSFSASFSFGNFKVKPLRRATGGTPADIYSTGEAPQ